MQDNQAPDVITLIIKIIFPLLSGIWAVNKIINGFFEAKKARDREVLKEIVKSIMSEVMSEIKRDLIDVKTDIKEVKETIDKNQQRVNKDILDLTRDIAKK